MQLSRREQEIGQLLVAGLSAKEISHQLGLSIHTVNQYIRSLYTKLQVNSRGACVAQLVMQLRIPVS